MSSCSQAAEGAFDSAGVTRDDVDAYWLGTAQSGMSGLLVSRPLRVNDKPVTRVENFCASGSEALRQAAYAVSSGAYDVAMAIGVEKLKDSGYQGANAFPVPSDGTNRTVTAAAMYSMIVPAYAKRYGVGVDEVKQALARIASKNHANGARNPAGAVPQGDERRAAPRHAARSRASSRSSTVPAWPTAPPPRSSSGPRTRTGTRHPRSS